MPDASLFSVVVASDAARRRGYAADVLSRHAARGGVTVVGATREAADELVREVACHRPATFGMSRFSLAQLAIRVAGPALAARGIAPATPLGFEAVAARAVFDLQEAQALKVLAQAATTPGFPRAVARTSADLRARRVAPGDLQAVAGPTARELALVHERLESELATAGAADPETLFTAAAAAVTGEHWLRAPLVLLDVSWRSAAEAEFVAALVAHASSVTATCHRFDLDTLHAFEQLGGTAVALEEPPATDVGHLRLQLFSAEPVAVREADGSVEQFSAPGEGRECVEIARRILREAARGVAFDDMAIFLRAPAHYQGLLEHALERGGIPAWFDQGTRRPHPVGRAFLALLACADERLSARRFAEYLSLGQVRVRASATTGPSSVSDAEASDGVPAPRKWEQMLVEAAVRRGAPERWRRRLAGLDAELRAREAEAARDDPDAPRAEAIRRDRQRLQALADFALPLLDELAAWPRQATWGDWIDLLEHVVPRVVMATAPVLGVLSDLRPMARVGPVTLREVRQVLTDRLRTVEAESPARRYGRVFVGAPEHARGRVFRVGFVPGLAERVFPEKLRQDPLLLDEARQTLGRGLDTMAARGARERLLLHLVVGACRERVHVSYPRLDVAESRARVPSFYSLDVARGVTGTIPDHRTFADSAARAGQSSLAWPAPPEPAQAIDQQEHDLAVVRRLLDASAGTPVRGRAQYLLRLNPALRRSVVERWARGEAAWSQYDGLMRVTAATSTALAANRLTARPYSASALQRYAACPYQFLLGAIHRLHLADSLDAPQRMDPLTRGSLVHRVQAVTLRALQAAGLTPLTPAHLDEAQRILADAVERVAAEFHDRLAPPIERVWSDEVAAIARDLRGWLTRVADTAAPWRPDYVEFGFGLPPHPDRDPRSVAAPVVVAGRYALRGAIDVVEVHAQTGRLRVTDHKTGKDRTGDTLGIGGGRVLQPLLYAAVAEQVLGATVDETRLFFCTVDGGYRERPVPLTPATTRTAIEALEVIDRAIETGVLLPAPEEGACTRCDFRAVCGPMAQHYPQHKAAGPLRDLQELRGRP
jgi:hypothetical protein